MNTVDLTVLAPIWIVAAAAVLLVVMIAVKRRFALTVAIALAGLAAGFAAIFGATRVAPRAVSPLFQVDGYTLFFFGLFFAAGLIILLLAAGYLGPSTRRREEFVVMILVALVGAATLAASAHFVSLVLGLEILSVSIAVMAAFPLERRESTEAGLKYLVLASASAAFVLFGGALIYGETGRLDLAAWTAPAAAAGGPLFTLGAGLIVVGIGFKLALVPFHLWTPDVYQGAPAPAAALVATVSKGAMLVFLVRFGRLIDLGGRRSLALVLALIAGASMIAGNLLALRQGRLKRILAYASISSLGAFLVAVLAGGTAGAEAAAIALVTYIVTMTAAFGAVSALGGGEASDADNLDDYRGLFWRRPALASVLALGLVSLAGIPATAGFLGKFAVAAAGVGSSLWALVLILVATSVVGLVYPFRVIVVMAARPLDRTPGGAAAAGPIRAPATAVVALAVLTLLLLWFGLFPAGLLDLIRSAAATLPGAVGLRP